MKINNLIVDLVACCLMAGHAPPVYPDDLPATAQIVRGAYGIDDKIPAKWETRNKYRLTELRWHDGDTLIADIHTGLDGVVLNDRSIRAMGYDAWEISRTRRTVVITDAELAKGKIAKKAAEELTASRETFITPTGERDPYGRFQGYLFVLTKDDDFLNVARHMEDNGHCRPGGTVNEN